MATTLIKLPAPQLGLISVVITTILHSSTQKELKKYKAQLFSFLRNAKPLNLKGYKAVDLTYIRKVYDAKTLDIFYEFWYEHNRDEIQ